MTQQNGMRNYEDYFNKSGLKKDGKQNALCRKVIFVFIILSTLICLSVLFYTIGMLVAVHKEHKETETTLLPTPQHLNVCMDCRKLAKNQYKLSVEDPNIQSLITRRQNGVLRCCAENPEQLSAMLDAIATVQGTMDPVIPMNEAPATVSVRKEALYFENIKTTKETSFNDEYDRYKSVFRFRTDENNILREGVNVLDNGLMILYTGYYFVYSGVSYTSDNIKESKNLFSYVHRMSPNSDNNTGVLLQTVHKSCQSCKQEFRTLYTGGVFLLKAGDLIQVFLSEENQHLKPESAYLGLVMLGNR